MYDEDDELDERMYQMMARDLEVEASCRVCGCSDDAPCEGGCEWVEEDLCSRCAEPHRAPAMGRQVA